jgi:hypothetical protein
MNQLESLCSRMMTALFLYIHLFVYLQEVL